MPRKESNKGNGRISSAEFGDVMRGGSDTRGGKKSPPDWLRSDLVVKGKEGEGAIGGKGRSIFKVDGGGKVSALPGPACACACYSPSWARLTKYHTRSVCLLSPPSCAQLERPAHLKEVYQPKHGEDTGTAKSARAGRHRSNFAAVSAESTPALRKFAHRKLASQPGLLIEPDGMALTSEIMGASKGGGSFESAAANVKHILYRDYHFVERSLHRHDKTGHGAITRRDLFLSRPSLCRRFRCCKCVHVRAGA